MSKVRDNMQLYLLEEGHTNEIVNKYKFKILLHRIINEKITNRCNKY